MEARLLKSGLVMVIALALAVSGTYAAFTSNSVTISASTLSTGTAEIKLCQADTAGMHDWRTTVAPGLTLSNLTPAANTSDPGTELTATKSILLGNDGGTLPASAGSFPGTCNTYGEAAGSSDVAMRILPTVVVSSCSSADMAGQLELRFALANSDETTQVAESDWKTLTTWGTNTTVMDQVGSSTDFVMTPNQVQQVKVFGRLKSTATSATQGQSCTFNIVLTGQQ